MEKNHQFKKKLHCNTIQLSPVCIYSNKSKSKCIMSVIWLRGLALKRKSNMSVMLPFMSIIKCWICDTKCDTEFDDDNLV